MSMDAPLQALMFYKKITQEFQIEPDYFFEINCRSLAEVHPKNIAEVHSSPQESLNHQKIVPQSVHHHKKVQQSTPHHFPKPPSLLLKMRI